MLGRARLPLALMILLASPARAQDAVSANQVKRGEYLARAADCIACHTAPGGKPYAGGLPFKLPFNSTLYSPNITPDKSAGIGDWSDDDFVRAMHKGVGKDGTHYYPAFPYTNYTLMPREDVLAIKAYLFSLAPVPKQPPASDLRFPLNQRWAMVFWNLSASPPTRRARPSGTAAPIWSRRSAIARPATRRATS